MIVLGVLKETAGSGRSPSQILGSVRTLPRRDGIHDILLLHLSPLNAGMPRRRIHEEHLPYARREKELYFALRGWRGKRNGLS